MREVLIALSISLVLVLVVIYAFLGNWRATLIPAVTIPISIIAACAAMYAMGFTINVLTLLGMVLAIGLVVDDAIVVLENIYRRIERGEQSLLAALDGSREIGFAVIATTLVLSAVFVPISFLTGRIGRLFSEFGFTLAASILFSCLVALTLTPMMASQLFRGGAMRSRVSHRVETIFARLAARYERLLRRVLVRPMIIVVAALALFAVTVAVFMTLPQESTPNEDRGIVRVSLTGPEGASLEYMQRYARQLEDILSAEAASGDIVRYNMRIPGGGGNVSRGEPRAVGFIVLRDWEDRERSSSEIAASIQKKLAALPGVRAGVFLPTAFNWGAQEPVKVVLQGPDYAQLAQWRNKILARAADNPGLINLDSDYQERKPQMKVSVDRNRAARPRRFARFHRPHAGNHAGLAHRHHLRARGTRVLRHPAGPDGGSRLARGPEQPVRALRPRLGADSAQQRGAAGGVSGAVQLNRFDRLRAITISAGLVAGLLDGRGDRVLPQRGGRGIAADRQDQLRRRVARVSQVEPGAVLDVPRGAPRGVPGARGAVREFHAAVRDHDHGAARAGRRGARHETLRRVGEHLQPDRRWSCSSVLPPRTAC